MLAGYCDRIVRFCDIGRVRIPVTLQDGPKGTSGYVDAAIFPDLYCIYDGLFFDVVMKCVVLALRIVNLTSGSLKLPLCLARKMQYKP